MARRKKSSSRRNKIEPAVMTLYIPTNTAGAGSTTNDYIDLSQVASLVNRRFYRQGLNWAVGGIKILSQSSFEGTVTVSKLPNTWVMANAWEKSMRVWMKMNNEALEESESVRPRFLDFKVYADATHHQLGYVANLLPTSLTQQAVLGEWEPSKIFHPVGKGAVEGQTVEEEIIAVGVSYPGASPVTLLDAVSMIEGYASSRLLPNVLDPNTPGDARDTDNFTPENWMAAIFNEGTEQTSDVLDELTSQNNIAPYPFENDGVNLDTMYPGGANQLEGLQIHDVTYVTGTTIGGSSRIKGGNFPCGLIRFDITNNGPTSNLVLMIDMIPGKHRGYLAETMTEM